MRYSSIDDFRGFSVFLMFTANFVLLFAQNPPLFLNHARLGVFLPLDLVAPMFGFSLGLCIPFTLAHLHRSPAFARLGRRVALLFLIGYLPDFYHRFSAGATLGQAAVSTWGILETWALGYLVAFLLSFVRLEFRLFVAAGLALVYQIFLLELPTVSGMVFSLVEGGPVAVLSWSVIIVAGTVFGELLLDESSKRIQSWGLSIGLTFLVFGLLAHFTLAPLDRISVSVAYTAFGTGISALTFLFFQFRRPVWGILFREAGKYPLTAWILQVLVYAPVYFTVGLGHFDWGTGGVLALLAVAGLFILTSFFQRVGLQIKV